MTNKRAERRERLYRELGSEIRIIREDVHKHYTDFRIQDRHNFTKDYRIYGTCEENFRIELFI